MTSTEDLEEVAGHSYLPVIAVGTPDFRGTIALHQLGSTMSLSEARMGPLRTSQTARMAAAVDQDDMLLFCIHLAGSGHLSQRDRSAELRPGVGVLYEARSPWVLDSVNGAHSLLLQFPRHALPLRGNEITDGLALGIDPLAPAMRLLSGYVGQLFQLADDIAAEQRQDAGLAAVEMLTMTLRGLRPCAPTDSSAGAALLGLMQTHIREHLSDSRLTVAELARRHHVSVRHVHALFDRLDVTPGAYLREQRLLAARTALATTLAIPDIAASVGFTDLRTFERAFHRQFGTTPARWRRDHVRYDSPSSD